MLNPFEYLDIQKQHVYAKYESQITLDKESFDEFIIESSDFFIVPGFFKIFIYEKQDFTSFQVNYDVNLYKTENYQETSDAIIIDYKPKELMIFQDYAVVGDNIKQLVSILEGRVGYIDNPETMIKILSDVLPGIDNIHFEIIVSNMFRKKSDPTQVCRLSGDYSDSIIYGQTKQSFTNSLLSSLAYQNIEKSLSIGLIKKTKITNNPIEKIINEDFYEKTKDTDDDDKID